MMFYSKDTNGFYDTAIHGNNIPLDAVEITADEHAALLNAQSIGKIIRPDTAGRPVATDAPSPTTDQLAAHVRAQRDTLISQCDWTVLPDASLAPEEQTTWRTYRQALRDVTTQPAFPFSIDWPMSPRYRLL